MYCPKWEKKTIEAASGDVGDATDSRKTRGQKQEVNVALMACVLETCDPKTYADAHDKSNGKMP
jgi:hypothetical protein